MLNIEPQIEKIVLHFYKKNTINEMVQTISHRFNTHVKSLPLSASVVIIIIRRLLATSKIITQSFNHLLLFYFTTSPLKIDEPLSTFNGALSMVYIFLSLFVLLEYVLMLMTSTTETYF